MAQIQQQSSENLIARRLREVSEAQPSKKIVSDGYSNLTLAQLGEQTDLLARRIYNALQNAPSQKVVPLVLDRSINSVMAIFACIKAGVGFALIDSENTQTFIDSGPQQTGKM